MNKIWYPLYQSVRRVHITDWFTGFLFLKIRKKGTENEKIIEEALNVREELISFFRYEQQNYTQTVHLIYNNL